jgi:hypothetical protein
MYRRYVSPMPHVSPIPTATDVGDTYLRYMSPHQSTGIVRSRTAIRPRMPLTIRSIAEPSR